MQFLEIQLFGIELFEYPYIIVTILLACFIFMGLIGVYFLFKSLKTVGIADEKGFISAGKIESEFEKAGMQHQYRSLIYIALSLDNTSRLYSESNSMRLLSRIRKCLLKYFSVRGASISQYEKNCFLAVSFRAEAQIKEEIEKCADEIQQILIQNGSVGIAYVRFGYYHTTTTEVNFRTAIGRAKQACSMAEAKDEVLFPWDRLSEKEFEQKIKIENSILSEIDNNRFFLEYQPIVDATTGEIVGGEVLSRLNSEDSGILPPKTFLSAVNNVGLNEKFDLYIFEKNCKWISHDKKKRGKYTYTVNFSRQTLCDEDFAKNILSTINRYELETSCISVEVLEDMNLTKEEKKVLSQNLKTLKEEGVLILLDDFGRGYTSFTDLTDFEIDIIKIDKAITQNAETKNGYFILRNIIQTAKDLGLKTLCEGVETEEQKKIATALGCDMLQGFYFSRPIPANQFEAMLPFTQ